MRSDNRLVLNCMREFQRLTNSGRGEYFLFYLPKELKKVSVLGLGRTINSVGKAIAITWSWIFHSKCKFELQFS